MRFLNVFRGRARQQPRQIVGHVAGIPDIVEHNGQAYMRFRLTEAGGVEFRLKILPMTPLRRKGDHVVVTLNPNNDEVLIVELLSGSP